MLSSLLKKRSLATLAAWSPTDLCQRFDAPGVGTRESLNYSAQPPTPDQRQIEDVLAGRDLRRARLLHVGVGDSSLARRLHGHCLAIDGITVSGEELARAEGLRLPGYAVHLVNKYSREFVRALQPGYDVIVDNNPASYACCRYHFACMVDNYRWALTSGGELLTAQLGIAWVVGVGDRAWRMTFDDLEAVGRRFDLSARRVTDAVYALRRE